MADLNQQDRLEISKKLVGIEGELLAFDQLAVLSAKNKINAENKDAPNKKILDGKTDFINIYQNELIYFDGITRSELTEGILEDAARRKLNNSFFPNDPASPLASVPDGVWKNFVPLSRNHAIGKTNLEVYPATGARTEQDIIDDINAEITTIESLPEPNKATGQQCNAGGACAGEDNPPQLTESACTIDNGTWTPGADSYSADASVASSLANLETLVQEWEDRMNAEKSLIPTATEKNSTRITGNTNAIADIDAAIVIVDNWQATQDFDTTTVLPTGIDGSGCILYDALEEVDFDQAKLQPTTLTILKDELTARSIYTSTRAGELTGDDYLGSITQDMDSGELTAFTGLYGERMLYIDMRLNVLGGTLSAVINTGLGGKIQQEQKNAVKIAGSALALVMAATIIVAPGLDTKFLNVKDGSLFVAGDRVYVAANDQEELSGSVISVTDNRVELSFKIPKKYTLINQTRLYKLL